MKINWIPTDSIYRRLVAETDPTTRRQIYVDKIVEPWRPMMSMVAGLPDDDLGGARAWAWLLPDQVEEIKLLLDQLESAGAWQIGKNALELATARFQDYAGAIPFNTVEGWLVLADPARSDPLQRGYTGATDWFQPRLIGQFSEAHEYVLYRLSGLLAHEMHHLIRLRVFPWDMQHTSVADYIVLEGLAEAFAASLFGDDKVGYYVTEITADDLEIAMRIVGEGLARTGFDVIRGYIFGDRLAGIGGLPSRLGMPDFGGYAVGYHVVREFLSRTGKSVEEATFLDADEIVKRSGMFSLVL